MDCILLIVSDASGNPNLNGGHGHFVRISDNPNMTTIAQMAAGGAYPAADCAIGCLMSALRDRGVVVTARHLEQSAGTTSSGTTLEGLSSAAAEYVQNHIASGDPTGQYVMNPAYGTDAHDIGDYLRASQHRMVVFDDPEQAGSTQPQGGGTPVTEDDTVNGLAYSPEGKHRGYIEDDGAVWIEAFFTAAGQSSPNWIRVLSEGPGTCTPRAQITFSADGRNAGARRQNGQPWSVYDSGKGWFHNDPGPE